jgi:hypothetical protein
MNHELTTAERNLLTRMIAGYILIFYLLRLYLGVTPSGLNHPPLFALEMDIIYWTFQGSGLANWLLSNPIAAISFDLLLINSGAYVIWKPQQVVAVFLFATLICLYVLLFNSRITHHTHAMCGIVLVLWPFTFRNQEKFNRLWEGLRYLTCFIYFMSFYWKAFIGDSFYQFNHGLLSVQGNLAEYIYHNPDTILSGFYQWMIAHPLLLNIGNTTIFLLEGAMVIGLFTRKFDHLLFYIPILVHVAGYFFSDVFFMEMLVLDFTLLPISLLSLNSIQHRSSFMLKLFKVGRR